MAAALRTLALALVALCSAEAAADEPPARERELVRESFTLDHLSSDW